MKKICMIIPSFSAKGGIASVVNGYKGSKLESKYNLKYIETYCDGGKIKKIWKAIIAYFLFIIQMFFNKPNVVHIHSSFGGSFYRKLPYIYISYFFKVPIINHIHGADFKKFYKDASNKKKYIIKKSYSKCLYIVALSQEWKDQLKLIVPDSKIQIIENYGILNTNGIEERKKKSNTFNILFLGFICKRKGCYDIPKIANKVLKEIPNAKFILAGSGEVENIKQITPKEIQENIIYPGWIRDKEKDKLLKEADIFFLPSYNEGMPMAILDAMGYGLPIVSSLVGGIPKIVLNNKNGFLTEPGNIENFSNFLIELLKNDKERKNFGSESINIIKNNYSLERHIEKIDYLYQLKV